MQYISALILILWTSAVLASGLVIGGGRVLTATGGVGAGEGYAINDHVTINGGASLCDVTITDVIGGVPQTISFTAPCGAGYTTGDKATTCVSCSGTGFTIDILTVN